MVSAGCNFELLKCVHYVLLNIDIVILILLGLTVRVFSNSAVAMSEDLDLLEIFFF